MWQIALERSGFDVKNYIAFETDKYAKLITNKNYADTRQQGDVFDGNYRDFKGFDLLIGGSPCTFWSINKRNRETSSEGLGYKLFEQYVRALDESGSEYFLYENNHRIHQDIQDEITKSLGVKPVLINSALVSAQKRYRLYWTNIPVTSELEDKKIYVKDIIDYNYKSDQNLIDEVKFKDNYSTDFSDKLVRIGTIGKGGQGERVYSVNGKSSNLTANGGGRGAKTGLYLIDDVVRKLTPLEAERLQNVPDGYTEGVSDSQRYKMLGNGWTVDVIAHIFKGLK